MKTSISLVMELIGNSVRETTGKWFLYAFIFFLPSGPSGLGLLREVDEED